MEIYIQRLLTSVFYFFTFHILYPILLKNVKGHLCISRSTHADNILNFVR